MSTGDPRNRPHPHPQDMARSQLAYLKHLNLTYLTRCIVNEDGFTDVHEALLCIEEYKRFLQLVAICPEVPLIPPTYVWLIWRRHMLNTRQYIADCGHIFALSSKPCSSGFRQSAYLHHVPENETGVGKTGYPAALYKKTVGLYWRVFGDTKEIGQRHVCVQDSAYVYDRAYSEKVWTMTGVHGLGHSLIAPLCSPDKNPPPLPTVPLKITRLVPSALHTVKPHSSSTGPKLSSAPTTTHVETSFFTLVESQLQTLLPALLPTLLRDHPTELPSEEAHIALAMSEYKRYLSLLLSNTAQAYLSQESEARSGEHLPVPTPPSSRLLPVPSSPLVDLIWHCHIMDSQRYARDCAALLAAAGVAVVGFKRGSRIIGVSDGFADLEFFDTQGADNDGGGVVGAVADLDGGSGAGFGYYSTLSSHAYLHHSPKYTTKPVAWDDPGFQHTTTATTHAKYTAGGLNAIPSSSSPLVEWREMCAQTTGCDDGTPGPFVQSRWLDREEFPWYYWLLLPCHPCSPWCRSHCIRKRGCCGARDVEFAWWGENVEDIHAPPPLRVVRYRAASYKDACLMDLGGSQADEKVPGVLKSTLSGCCPCLGPPSFEPVTNQETGARVFLRFHPLTPMPLYYWCIPPVLPCSRPCTLWCDSARLWACCAAQEFDVTWYTGLYEMYGDISVPPPSWGFGGGVGGVHTERFRAGSLLDACLVGLGGISISRDRPGEVRAKRPTFPTPFLCLLPVICPWTLCAPRFEKVKGGGGGGGASGGGISNAVVRNNNSSSD